MAGFDPAGPLLHVRTDALGATFVLPSPWLSLQIAPIWTQGPIQGGAQQHHDG
eukprot:CAMPEP_0179200194 /NCGR_PEP_ID=MMETSP0796-20121207/99626_1 /TAXON_ID=73915 /ORGANISM="Pyrodinium bahamense, Strain pbaha01" /LENGTH=52 /DNA_ID=CAMNT_0020904741 /DNA_START=32 /DNA_END=190 /DNA_ORIENTATION=-